MTQVKQCQCYCCQELTNHPDKTYKTTRICVMILKSLETLKPGYEYFSLKTDVIEFINTHWSLLSQLKQFQTANWRKGIMDAFNHCTLIESGKSQVDQRGFYRLKVGGVDRRTLLKKERMKLTQQTLSETQISGEQQTSEQYLRDYVFEYQHHLQTIGQELSMQVSSVQSQLKETQQLLLKKYSHSEGSYNQNKTKEIEYQFLINQCQMHIDFFNQHRIPL